MPWDDIWPPDDAWPLDDRWGFTTAADEFGPGGLYQTTYSKRYDLDAATPEAQAARARDRWAIFVRNANRKIVETVGVYRHVTGLVQHNAVGAWTLELPLLQRDGTTNPAAAALLEPQAGIVVMRNGKVVLSGPVRDITDTFSTDDGSWLSLTGPDDWTHLADHPALPAPGAPPNVAGNFNVQAYDERIGLASGLIGQYLAVNITNPPSNRAARRIGGLIYTDPGIGSTVTIRGRWQRLGRLVRQVCNLSDPQLGIRVRQSAERDEIDIDVYVPTDRTVTPNRVVFSESLGNLLGFTYKRTAGPNYFYDAGSGEGTERGIREGGNPEAIAQDGLIEAFVAHSDLDSVADLDAAIKTDLQEQGPQWSFVAEVKETSTFRWGDDFDLGDKVIADYRGREIPELLRQVEFELTPERNAVVMPRVGSLGAKFDPKSPVLKKIVDDHESRLSDLERV